MSKNRDNPNFRMRILTSLRDEVDRFCEETSIHGFPYLATSKRFATRIIWAVIVSAAFIVATNFLLQSFESNASNPISTSIDTIGVEEVHFPAVTIYPGNYRNKKALTRRLLNYFQFSRYDENDALRNNTMFLSKFSWFLKMSFLYGKWSEKLLDSVQRYLKNNDTNFYPKKKGLVKNEVCTLIALKNKNSQKAENLVNEIKGYFQENLFKYKSFSAFSKVITKQ